MSELIAHSEDGTETQLPDGIEVAVVFELPGGNVFRHTLSLTEIARSASPEMFLMHAFNHIMSELIGTLQLQSDGEPDIEPLVEQPANPFDPAEMGENMIPCRVAGQVPGLLDKPDDLLDADDDGLSMEWPEEIFCPPPEEDEEQDAG